jgi:hypothetical protein
MIASEYARVPATVPVLLTSELSGPIPQTYHTDERSWYVMASYKLTSKLTAGAYESQYFDHASSLGPWRYQKAFVLNGHYDFNQYIYAKVEEQFVKGDGLNLDQNMNPNGMKTNFNLTLLKLGVSF